MRKLYINNKAFVVAAFLAATASLTFSSCSKKSGTDIVGETTNLDEVFATRLQAQIDNINAVINGAVFGDKKGNYPLGSKNILADRLAYLEETLEKLKNGTKKLLKTDMDNIILDTNTALNRFKSTVLTADFVSEPAELYVAGKSGGYIDFGTSPAFSAFDSGFTVDFWVKFASLGSFDFILSTFIDNGNPSDRYRYGWASNFFGEGGNSLIRMTYAIGKDGLFEPGINGFNTTNQWVHLAYVWNPAKFTDGASVPATFKMYINGNLVKAEDWGNTNYTPNDKTSLIGFNYTKFDGSVATDGKGTNGTMKHIHIWNKVKTQTELQQIMNTPQTVTGKEADLVAGWKFTETVADDSNILDLTGKHSAKVRGNHSWVK